MRWIAWVLLVAVSIAGIPSAAQELSTGTVSSPVITIDQDLLYAGSAWGKRAIGALEAASADLAAENRGIEADLTREERDLTDRRALMPAQDFREAADIFDARVVGIRSEQDRKLRALSTRRDAERKAFFQAILPILEAVMRNRGASVVLDARATLLASSDTDVTAEVIARADREIGDGAGIVQVPAAGAGDTTPKPDATPEPGQGGN